MSRHFVEVGGIAGRGMGCAVAGWFAVEDDCLCLIGKRIPDGMCSVVEFVPLVAGHAGITVDVICGGWFLVGVVGLVIDGSRPYNWSVVCPYEYHHRQRQPILVRHSTGGRKVLCHAEP
jgi:hypothetical protein